MNNTKKYALNKTIYDILALRGIKTEEEIEKFLFPSKQDFLNPYLLNNMQEAVSRINQAVEQKQTILIYGDYDADGICSVSMFYLYLKSVGVDVSVFIPNRHTDGYGLNENTINFLAENYFPDLIITVDCGITAIEEVEIIKDLGIDVIVTDHHLPAENLPNCIIIDPKIKGQEYSFDGLSGAGVVFKIIHALSDLETALQYVDICAISTVGDIVPLLNENRIITKLGLEKINGKSCRKSIKFLKDKLQINYLTSQDITYKIVPRLNASGRMNSSIKCFEFLVEEDEQILSEKFDEIENDNNERLKISNLAFVDIQEKINNTDFENNPAIFIRDDNLNLGLIGVIASKLCHNYSRPVFVFSKDDNGNLKASVRSIEGIDIFKILDSFRDLMLDIGGHSLAGGLTISEENYEVLKEKVQNYLSEFLQKNTIKQKAEYDAIISENEMNINFGKQILQLEPFGHMNPKPVFMIKSNDAQLIQMRSFKHNKINLSKGREIFAFFGEKYTPYFAGKNEKEICFTFEFENYKGVSYLKYFLKNVNIKDIANIDNKDFENSFALQDVADSVCLNNKTKLYNDIDEIAEYANKKYKTLIITNNFENAKLYSNRYNLEISYNLKNDGKTIVLYNPFCKTNLNDLKIYKHIIFADGFVSANQYNIYGQCFAYNKKLRISEITDDRNVFVKIYKALSTILPISGNNIYEVCNKIQKVLQTDINNKDTANANFKNHNYTPSIPQIALAILVYNELEFIEISTNDSFEIKRVQKIEKKDLSKSKLYNIIPDLIKN